MNKLFILSLLSLGACISLGIQNPASAMLSEDPQMLRSFYANPGRWPIEKHVDMKRFGTVRRELGPQLVQFFPDQDGLVQREYWLADSDMWTVTEANRIRAAIMKNRNAVASGDTGFRAYQFVYADGTRIYYRMARGMVFSILAVRNDFNPGDLGAKPEAFWKMMRMIRPED